MKIRVETHRVMGVDTVELPIGTRLQARGHDSGDGDVWTAVSRPPADDEPGIGEALGCTIPGGFVEIYAL